MSLDPSGTSGISGKTLGVPDSFASSKVHSEQEKNLKSREKNSM